MCQTDGRASIWWSFVFATVIAFWWVRIAKKYDGISTNFISIEAVDCTRAKESTSADKCDPPVTSRSTNDDEAYPVDATSLPTVGDDNMCNMSDILWWQLRVYGKCSLLKWQFWQVGWASRQFQSWQVKKSHQWWQVKRAKTPHSSLQQARSLTLRSTSASSDRLDETELSGNVSVGDRFCQTNHQQLSSCADLHIRYDTWCQGGILSMKCKVFCQPVKGCVESQHISVKKNNEL